MHMSLEMINCHFRAFHHTVKAHHNIVHQITIYHNPSSHVHTSSLHFMPHHGTLSQILVLYHIMPSYDNSHCASWYFKRFHTASWHFNHVSWNFISCCISHHIIFFTLSHVAFMHRISFQFISYHHLSRLQASTSTDASDQGGLVVFGTYEKSF